MMEVDRTVTHMKDEAANFPDPNDRATQEEEFSLELRTRDRERKLIRKIDDALKRVEDGSYGYCLETGEEIGIKRLEARPVATLSLEAQERRERRERQYGDRDDRYRGLIGRYARPGRAVLRPRRPAHCIWGRSRPPPPAFLTPASTVAGGCCAWKISTDPAKSLVPPTRSCVTLDQLGFWLGRPGGLPEPTPGSVPGSHRAARCPRPGLLLQLHAT